MNRRRIFFAVTVVSLLIAAIFVLVTKGMDDDKTTSTNGTNEYEEVRSYSDGNYLYSCSIPIKVHYEKIPPGEGGDRKAVPQDESLASKYCKQTAIF